MQATKGKAEDIVKKQINRRILIMVVRKRKIADIKEKNCEAWYAQTEDGLKNEEVEEHGGGKVKSKMKRSNKRKRDDANIKKVK